MDQLSIRRLEEKLPMKQEELDRANDDEVSLYNDHHSTDPQESGGQKPDGAALAPNSLLTDDINLLILCHHLHIGLFSQISAPETQRCWNNALLIIWYMEQESKSDLSVYHHSQRKGEYFIVEEINGLDDEEMSFISDNEEEDEVPIHGDHPPDQQDPSVSNIQRRSFAAQYLLVNKRYQSASGMLFVHR
ncbi:hypothetical protein BDA99DRAFT_559830 [Phascolomyces articulosus]|uniref:Uncharacterized protein n=1 Tax=Phascolomyces articulosus TaxID=60185 RepID=A0AAD5PE95_9FUNG|nr:hypothetical protein BDA99DRAFT_559830 [Phascolomyces articulosus]